MTALFPCPCCGHSITKQDAAGFRIIGKDEVDQVTVEKCAEVVEATPISDTLSPKKRIADAIRAIGRKA